MTVKHTYYGDRLRLIREGLKLSRPRFAAAMGINRWTLAEYESKGVLPHYDTIWTIAKRLGLSTDFFFPPRAENDAGRLYPLTACLARARRNDLANRLRTQAS